MNLDVNITVNFDQDKFESLFQYMNELWWLVRINYYNDPEDRHKNIEAAYLEERMWKWITECGGTIEFIILDEDDEYREKTVLIDLEALKTRVTTMANKSQREYLMLGTGEDDLEICDALLQQFFYGEVIWG